MDHQPREGSASTARNIEIKARCDDLDRARSRAQAIGAEPAGILHQIDTYFPTKAGRLKLRQINSNGVDRAELIWYHRTNEATARESNYHVVPLMDASLMLAALSAGLGVRGSVRKRRDLLLWHNVRIHLDMVENLGPFIEFEAVLSDQDDETISRARLEELSRALEIGEQIACSYCDLLGL